MDFQGEWDILDVGLYLFTFVLFLTIKTQYYAILYLILFKVGNLGG
jgi:hypothetical protein